MTARSRAETLRLEQEERVAGAQRRARAPAPTEEQIVRGLQEGGIDLDTIEVVRFGLEMQAFVEHQPVGRYLVSTAEAQLGENIRKLLDLDSLDGPIARDAHFKARVAVGILKIIEEATVSGQEAEASIRERSAADEAPEPGNDE
jgi:hypothetical protein